MKKTFIFTFLLSFIILAASCNSAYKTDKTQTPQNTQKENVVQTANSVESKTQQNPQNKTNTPPNKAAESSSKNDYQFKDDDFYLRYIGGLDLCLPEFAFTDNSSIKTEDLYLFFCYIVDAEKLFNYEEWLDRKEHKYHVPALVIEPTLKRYLNIKTIDVNKIEGYDKDKNEISLFYAGWGGGRWPKLDKKEYLGNNTFRLTATFYDETYTKAWYTNVYVIQIDPTNDKNYKYMSIELGHDL